MKRLLVALDTTENSLFVLARATELARGLGATIRLVTAVEMPPIVAAPGVGPIYVDPAALTGPAEARLREREHEVPESLRDGIAVEVGLPSDVICSVAGSYDADLVVIGAHRHGALARMLGTTAAKIANRIDRPLIVVRPTPADDAPAAAHTLLETAGLAGAAVGAVVGIAGGPPGAIVGSVIGAGIGMLVGQVLDKETARADAHDRILDDAMGVTRGDLGARERAVSGLDASEHAQRAGSEIVSIEGGTQAGALLRRDHARLEKTYDALLTAYRSDDWEQVRAQWDRFEPAIRAHMDTEEQLVFPVLRAVDHEEADALLAEHAELRRLVATLGVAVDLHAFPAA